MALATSVASRAASGACSSFMSERICRPGSTSTSFPAALPILSARNPRIGPFVIRASDKGLDGLSSVLDKKTKKEITKEDVLTNQEQNESEKRSVFGAVPPEGSLLPRPEIQRRPETGSKSFANLMTFDGAGPETINGRLAMVGFVWAFLVERSTGQTVAEQLYAPGNFGLFNFFVVAQVFTYASLIPMFKGESPDSRSFGPFRAMAERWNGRAAMIGFLSLVLTEVFIGAPVFRM